jgi:mercuric ion transport protein
MQTVKHGLAVLLALVTCPCHLPLLLALPAGTGAGVALAAHTGLVAGALTPIFMAALAFLVLANRGVPTAMAEALPGEDPAAPARTDRACCEAAPELAAPGRIGSRPRRRR